MPIASLPILPPTLASGFCFEDWQQIANKLVGGATVQFFSTSFTTIITSASTPAAVDRDKIWFNTVNNRLYQWNSAVGAWTSKHPTDANSSVRMLWVGSLGDLETFDGGAAGTVGDAAGPMWQRDTTFDARFPVGVGTFPSTTAVAVNGTGGEETHVLTEEEMPEHNHSLESDPEVETTWGYKAGAGGSYGAEEGNDTIQTTLTVEDAGEGEAHNNLPPYIGVYFIKRSSRIFYTA
jgi:hypothetical protein